MIAITLGGVGDTVPKFVDFVLKTSGVVIEEGETLPHYSWAGVIPV